MVWFNNMPTVNMSNNRLGMIRPGASCVDILRNAKKLRNKTTVVIEYGHVDGHTDKYLLWH